MFPQTLQATSSKNSVKLLLYLYYIVGGVYVLFCFIEYKGPKIISAFFKAAPLFIMMYIINKSYGKMVAGPVILGLFFSALGDTALEFRKGDILLVVGALFFLLTHAVYNYCVIRLWENKKCNLLQVKSKAIFGVTCILYVSFILFLFLVKEKIEKATTSLIYVVPIYLILIVMDIVNAYLHVIGQKQKNFRYKLLLFGTIFYFLCDQIVIRNALVHKFIISQRINDVIMMSFYYLAQNLIPINICQLSRKQGQIQL